MRHFVRIGETLLMLYMIPLDSELKICRHRRSNRKHPQQETPELALPGLRQWNAWYPRNLKWHDQVRVKIWQGLTTPENFFHIGLPDERAVSESGMKRATKQAHADHEDP